MTKISGLTMGLAAALCLGASAAYGASVSIPIHAVSTGKAIGTVDVSETPNGLDFKTDLTDLPPGYHGFHIHEHPSCADAAMAAGGHWDPDNTGRHAGPYGDGHRGDLPKLSVDAQGRATDTVQAPRIKTLEEIYGHTFIVHEGGDNYSDQPLPLGGGGKRIGCGVIYAPHD
ncbi:hypothetical protein EC968_003771 [Mortierella alpina]|nr:hypothetical protein EC968_003771 [Mortierella alpina]